MGEWFSIEVFDGATAARAWVDSFGDALIEAGIASGALEWNWHHRSWGSLLEIKFTSDDEFELFKHAAVVEAAFDAVPDRVAGLLIYRGRGGGSGALRPRHPRPFRGSGAIGLPIPLDIQDDWIEETYLPKVLVAR